MKDQVINMATEDEAKLQARENNLNQLEARLINERKFIMEQGASYSIGQRAIGGWTMRAPELRAEPTYVYVQKPQIPFTQIRC